MKYSSRSRLSRRYEQQTRKKLLFNIIGTLILLFVLFKFGLPFLIQTSTFISGSKNDTGQTKNTTVFVAPPVLNPLPTATNSAEIIVSGVTVSAETVELFINDKLSSKVKVAKDGSFTFENVTLKKGENIVKAKAITREEKESDYSLETKIIVKIGAPALTLDAPLEGASFGKDQNPIEVKGKTDPGVTVRVNGFWAIVDTNGEFSYSLRLQNGGNKIIVSAVDEAGNKSETERKITSNQ